MPAAIKGSFEKDLDQFPSGRSFDEMLTEGQDIRVIMSPAEPNRLFHSPEDGTDAMHLIRGNGHTHAAVTHQYSALGLARSYTFTHLAGVIRIISGVRRVRAEVGNLMAGRKKGVPQLVFEPESSMVGTNCDSHRASILASVIRFSLPRQYGARQRTETFFRNLLRHSPV